QGTQLLCCFSCGHHYGLLADDGSWPCIIQTIPAVTGSISMGTGVLEVQSRDPAPGPEMWRSAFRCVESWSVQAHHALKALSLCRAALCLSSTLVSAPPFKTVAAPLLTVAALRQCSKSGKAAVFNISFAFLQKGLGSSSVWYVMGNTSSSWRSLDAPILYSLLYKDTLDFRDMMRYKAPMATEKGLCNSVSFFLFVIIECIKVGHISSNLLSKPRRGVEDSSSEDEGYLQHYELMCSDYQLNLNLDHLQV
ncbi:hypothetical protein AKJ16_DCAP00587, partial [Drosera capensis]